MNHLLEALVIVLLGGECIEPKCLEYKDNSNYYFELYSQSKDLRYFNLAIVESNKYKICVGDEE